MLFIDRVPDPKFIGSSLPRVEDLTLAPPGAVAAELFDHGTVTGQEGQGGIGGVWIGKLVVGVKDIMPRLAMDWPRFDPGEVGSLAGEDLEGFDQGSGAVLDGKGKADLVG